MKDKIALFCNVDAGQRHHRARRDDASTSCRSSCTAQGLDERLAELLNIWSRAPRLERWERIVETVNEPASGEVRIGIVGKYVDLKESLQEPQRGAASTAASPTTCGSTSSTSTPRRSRRRAPQALLADVDAILVPGGFGERGTEGKIAAVRYAREKKVPFFGICLGMQMAVVEFARNVLRPRRRQLDRVRRDDARTR